VADNALLTICFVVVLLSLFCVVDIRGCTYVLKPEAGEFLSWLDEIKKATRELVMELFNKVCFVVNKPF